MSVANISLPRVAETGPFSVIFSRILNVILLRIVKARHVGRLLPAELLPSPAEHSFCLFVIDQSKALVAIGILRNVVDALHVVIAESNQFNVLLDTDRVRALRQNDHTTLNIPAQYNFSRRHTTANFLCNLDDVGVLEDRRVRLTSGV